jgi:hypothetical protein
VDGGSNVNLMIVDTMENLDLAQLLYTTLILQMADYNGKTYEHHIWYNGTNGGFWNNWGFWNNIKVVLEGILLPYIRPATASQSNYWKHHN